MDMKRYHLWISSPKEPHPYCEFCYIKQTPENRYQPCPIEPQTIEVKPLDIEQEAQTLIEGARREEYGDMESSFIRIAEMWSVILGGVVTARQVALMMICLKVIRESHAHKHDNLVDIIGYAKCLEKLAEEK